MKHTNTHEDTYQKTQHKGIDTSTTICRKRKNEDVICWFRRKSVFYCVIYFVFASKNTFLYSCVSLYMFVFLCVTVLLSMFPPNFSILRNLQFFILFLYCVYSVFSFYLHINFIVKGKTRPRNVNNGSWSNVWIRK